MWFSVYTDHWETIFTSKHISWSGGLVLCQEKEQCVFDVSASGGFLWPGEIIQFCVHCAKLGHDTKMSVVDTNTSKTLLLIQ